MSICILPEFRGNGMAQELINEYHNILRANGRKVCLLSVETGNGRAIKFYERNGYEIYKNVSTDKRVYAKLL